jgi:hypothetical protein
MPIKHQEADSPEWIPVNAHEFEALKRQMAVEAPEFVITMDDERWIASLGIGPRPAADDPAADEFERKPVLGR